MSRKSIDYSHMSKYPNGLDTMSTTGLPPFEDKKCMVPLMDNSRADCIRKDVETIMAVVDTKKDTMEPEIKLKKKRTGSWKNEWFNFSQSTTLHGICKVTEDTPFTARRYGF